jgi:hypothetical protein
MGQVFSCQIGTVEARVQLQDIHVEFMADKMTVGYWKDCLELELQYSHKCSLYSVSVCAYTVGVKQLKAAVKSRACRPMGRVRPVTAIGRARTSVRQ